MGFFIIVNQEKKNLDPLVMLIVVGFVVFEWVGGENSVVPRQSSRAPNKRGWHVRLHLFRDQQNDGNDSSGNQKRG